MDAQRGAFFVIEGTDGSGKATQFALLKDRLEQEGYKVVTFDFPQYDKPSSYFVRRYLDGSYGTGDAVGPYAGSLFYALDRYEAAKDIKEALDKGYIVLANRFTGSNMAHQGAKFNNPSERRGYYIWLDSLEFMVLGIPRPDLNFVLRVPAKIARALAEKRAELQYAGAPLDLHEADFSRIETTVRVYDELCQLFPKDFKQIDCVRSSALMTVEQIQQMLWETLQPHLPSVPAGVLAPLETRKQPAIETAPKPPENDKKTVHISSLTAAQIGLPYATELKVDSKKKPYYIPSTLKDTVRFRYVEVMDSLFQLYAEMQHRIPAEQAGLLRSVLPVATLQPHTVPDVHYGRLNQLDAAEARVVRASLGIQSLSGPSAFTRGNTIARMASDLLGTPHTQQIGDEVRIISALPRNELDIVPLVLYPSSGQPLQVIQNLTAEWSYEQKSALYLAYLATGNDAAHALANIRYLIDCRVSFGTVRNLQTIAPHIELTWQELSPRLGFDVPESIEEAGLADLYERCFDISLELYSELQAAGLHNEAQYAVLHGHFVQCNLQFSGLDVRILNAKAEDSTTDTKDFINTILENISRIHPLLLSDTPSGT